MERHHQTRTNPGRSCRQGSPRRTAHSAVPVRADGDADLPAIGCTVFLSCFVDSQIPEPLGLATTIDTWWPEINAFIATGITNARTEGYRRPVKQVKRAACGFRNPQTRPGGYASITLADNGPRPGVAADCPVKFEEL